MAIPAPSGCQRKAVRQAAFPVARAAVLFVGFIGFWAVSPVAWGLGLGALRVESNLGSPLQASAPVSLGSGESAGDLEAALASESDYQLVGAEPPALLRQLQVRLTGGEEPSLRITSASPIRDPLFEVMVRVGSDGNRILKMYTITLNPPQIDTPEGPGQPREAAASGSEQPEPRVRSRDLPAEGATAGRAAGGAEAGPAVERPDVRVTEGWAKRNRYGPVRSGDALSTIVQRLRRNPSVPLSSAIVATWRANKDAFIDNNMNLLRQGAVLDVPQLSRVQGIPPDQARSIIREQRKAWVAREGSTAEPSPGHRRYQVQVSLQEGGAQTPAEGDAPSDPARSAGADNPAAGGEGGTGAGADPAKEGGNANGGPDGGTGQQEGTGPETAALVAELRTQMSELRQTLEDQRSDARSSIQALEKQVSGLQETVEQQRKLINQQSASLKELAQQGTAGGSGAPSRERYILWILAGINLLMLVAIIALWLRLRALNAATAGEGPPPAVGPTGTAPHQSGAGEPADPLGRAHAQAESGQVKQARSTLWEAIAADPENWAAYEQLLGLYEQEEDGDQFEEVARRLFGRLGDDRPDWQAEIRARGHQLKPESPLFAGTGGSGGEEEEEEALAFEGVDFAPAEEPEQAAGPGQPEAPGAEAGEPEDTGITFDLGEDAEAESAPDEATGSAGEGAGLEAEGKEADLELDLGGTLGEASEKTEETEEGSADASGEGPREEAGGSGEAEEELVIPGWGEEPEGPEDSGGSEREPESAEGAAGSSGDEEDYQDFELDLDLESLRSGPEGEGEGTGSREAEGAAPEAGPPVEEEDLGWTWETEAAAEEPDQADESGGGGQDDFEIKLDLARAWLDMGDQESARGLLQEVEAQGSPDQQERAQELLASLR